MISLGTPVELLTYESRPHGTVEVALQLGELNVYANLEWDPSQDRVRLIDATDDDYEQIACLPPAVREYVDHDANLAAIVHVAWCLYWCDD